MTKNTFISDAYVFAKARWKLLVIAPFTAIGYANSVHKYFGLGQRASELLNFLLSAVIVVIVTSWVYQFGRYRVEEAIRAENKRSKRKQVDSLQEECTRARERIAACRRVLQYPPQEANLDAQLAQGLHTTGMLQKKISMGLLRLEAIEIRPVESSILLGIGRREGVVDGLTISVVSPHGSSRACVTAADLRHDCTRLHLPTLDLHGVAKEQISLSFVSPTDQEIGRQFQRERVLADALLALDD